MKSKKVASRDRDTERRILDAADRIFLRHGTAGARMQEIAELAGVNQALLHYYFRTKERLAKAVFVRAASQFIPALVGLMASDAPLEAKIRRFVALELDHLSRHPHLPAYILSELGHHPDRAGQLVAMITGMAPARVGAQVFGALRAQIDERVRAGTMRAIAPEQFMVHLLSLCIFPFAARPLVAAIAGMDHAEFERFMRRRRVELVTFFLNGLRP